MSDPAAAHVVIEPASELPWKESGTGYIVSRNPPAVIIDSSVRAQDARYIVHACNAYPKLVATMRDIIENGCIGKAHALALKEASKLLGELGE